MLIFLYHICTAAALEDVINLAAIQIKPLDIPVKFQHNFRITNLNLCHQLFFSHLLLLRHFDTILLQNSFAAWINTFTD